MMELGLGDLLIDILKNNQSSHKEDPRLSQLALGAVRNLSLQIVDNKLQLAKKGLLPLLVTFLKDGNAHTRFNAVGVAKSMLLGQDTLIGQFESTGVLSALLEVARENPSEGNERVQYEAARTLVILLEKKGEAAERCKKEIGKEVEGEGEKKENFFLKPFIFLISSKFDVLNAEGVRGVVALCSSEEGQQKVLSYAPELTQSLLSLLLPSSSVPSQVIAIDGLNFLAKLNGGKEKLKANPELLPALEKLKSSADPKVVSHLSKSGLLETLSS
eukprot:TRINITY_DN3150_c0_g1_i1.p1 TRINITY_DN3150_c0_g1~~TRINITY_DN3150_c0_g1_i1.p1  ORF type:complete len:317 (-),score=131.72 TRINITY_DN3150_c0_g1_i1:199-1017(-)